MRAGGTWDAVLGVPGRAVSEVFSREAFSRVIVEPRNSPVIVRNSLLQRVSQRVSVSGPSEEKFFGWFLVLDGFYVWKPVRYFGVLSFLHCVPNESLHPW